MAGLRFFLPALFVLSAFGQTPQNAADPSHITKEAVQAILGNNLGQGRPRQIAPGLNVLPFSASVLRETSCSVPLIEVQIPRDTNFVIARVPPASDFKDNMPVAHGLSACPTNR